MEGADQEPLEVADHQMHQGQPPTDAAPPRRLGCGRSAPSAQESGGRSSRKPFKRGLIRIHLTSLDSQLIGMRSGGMVAVTARPRELTEGQRKNRQRWSWPVSRGIPVMASPLRFTTS